jgi:hypothetical protein
MVPFKKRSASDTASSVDTKRQRTSAFPTAATLSSLDAFDVQVLMDAEFEVYPERLRESVQRRHERLICQMMDRFEKGQPLKPTFEYAMTRKMFSYPRDRVADSTARLPKRYPAVSLANQAVLKELIERVPPPKKITELKVDRERGEEVTANPEFAQLHAVRNGEMGWGVDMFGCLSLQLTTRKDGRLRNELIFVERVEPTTINPPTVTPSTIDLSTARTSMVDPKTVKVEEEEDDDDDCCIVEGPNATKESKLKDATAVEETSTIKEETAADEGKVTTDEEKVVADKAPMKVKKEDTTDQKTTATVKEEVTATTKKLTTYKAPMVTDVADDVADDDDDCLIVDSPNAAR